jgi:hypothetical protein
VLSTELAQRIEAGMPLLVGTVDVDGRPFASRGWGIRVIDPAGGVIRLLVDADDATTLANLAGQGRVAVTAAGVVTFFAIQMKGRAVALEEPTAADLEAGDEWCDAFFSTLESADGYSRTQADKWRRSRVLVAVVHVDQLYNQTPGPSAGSNYVTAS